MPSLNQMVTRFVLTGPHERILELERRIERAEPVPPLRTTPHEPHVHVVESICVSCGGEFVTGELWCEEPGILQFSHRYCLMDLRDAIRADIPIIAAGGGEGVRE